MTVFTAEKAEFSIIRATCTFGLTFVSIIKVIEETRLAKFVLQLISGVKFAHSLLFFVFD